MYYKGKEIGYVITKCTDDDTDFIIDKLDRIRYFIFLPENGAEDEYVLLKVTDDEENRIAGCIVEIDRRFFDLNCIGVETQDIVWMLCVFV